MSLPPPNSNYYMDRAMELLGPKKASPKEMFEAVMARASVVRGLLQKGVGDLTKIKETKNVWTS
jgi:hypothetical protein